MELKSKIMLLSGAVALLGLMSLSCGNGVIFKESYGDSNLSILVLIDSIPNDKGRVTVHDDDGDYSQSKTYKTDSLGSTTVKFSAPSGTISKHEEFTAFAKSDEADLCDGDKSENRPVDAPEHVAVNLWLCEGS
jgi:hypothetical protein